LLKAKKYYDPNAGPIKGWHPHLSSYWNYYRLKGSPMLAVELPFSGAEIAEGNYPCQKPSEA
jgi:hypothetical protein